MGLQYNMGPGQPMYAPGRDISYLYPELIATAEQRLYEGPFKPLAAWLRQEGVTEADLARTVQVYCQFINSAHKQPDETVEECLSAVGWFDQPPAARVALMFYMGAAVTGSIFSAVRDITKLGEDPPHVNRLRVMGDRVARYMNAGVVRRYLLRLLAKWPKRPVALSR